MKPLLASLLALTILSFGIPAAGQGQEGIWPTTAKIDPLKKKIFFSEQIDIILTDIRGPDGRLSKPEFLIHVQPKHGSISNGQYSPLSISGAGKDFPVGSGTIEVHYASPSDASIEKDLITISAVITSAYWEEEDDPSDFPTLNKIGEVEIEIIRFNYARIIYTETKNVEYPNQKESKEVQVITCVSFYPVFGQQHHIDRVRVMSWHGAHTYEGNDRDRSATLTHAEVEEPAPLIVFHRDEKNEIHAITLPQLFTSLEWTPADAFKSPEKILIGPVNDYPKSENKDLDKLVKELRPEKRGLPNLKNINELMKSTYQMLYHPDFKVTNRFSKTHLCGEAAWEESSEHIFHRKRYTWEVRLKP